MGGESRRKVAVAVVAARVVMDLRNARREVGEVDFLRVVGGGGGECGQLEVLFEDIRSAERSKVGRILKLKAGCEHVAVCCSRLLISTVIDLFLLEPLTSTA